MGRGFVRVLDGYVEWSTVVDAPITRIMTMHEVEEQIKNTDDSPDIKKQRIDRLIETGTTFVCMTAQELFVANRAGENETCISEKEIHVKYSS